MANRNMSATVNRKHTPTFSRLATFLDSHNRLTANTRIHTNLTSLRLASSERRATALDLAVPRRLLAARAAQCAVICSDGPYSRYHHPVYRGTKSRDISIAEVTVFCGLQSAIRNAVTSLWYYSERQIVCCMTTPRGCI